MIFDTDQPDAVQLVDEKECIIVRLANDIAISITGEIIEVWSPEELVAKFLVHDKQGSVPVRVIPVNIDKAA